MEELIQQLIKPYEKYQPKDMLQLSVLYEQIIANQYHEDKPKIMQ